MARRSERLHRPRAGGGCNRHWHRRARTAARHPLRELRRRQRRPRRQLHLRHRSSLKGRRRCWIALIEIRSPFDPDIATRDIAIVLKSYGISKTTADHYAAGWAVSAFARNSIKLEHSERNRCEIYLDALPLFTAGRVKLIDNQRLAAQFYSLERRTFPSGRTR